MSVKEYVEGMPGSEKVLDLLAVTADEDADADGTGIEQTRVAAARAGVVYPEVRSAISVIYSPRLSNTDTKPFLSVYVFVEIASSSGDASCRREDWEIAPRLFQRESIQLS